MKTEWKISGSGLPDLEIEADSFDEAVAKARLIDKRYCGGQIIDNQNQEEKGMRYRDFSSMSDRSNNRLNDAIERHIDGWDGTIHGQTIKNMYENGSDYESICEAAGIDYEDYAEE